MRKLYALLIIPMLATGAAWAKGNDKAKRAEASRPTTSTEAGTETRASETQERSVETGSAGTGTSSSGDVSKDVTGGTNTSRTTKTTSESTEATGTTGSDGMTSVPGVRSTTETATVAKNDYIKSAEAKLSDFESRVSKLKADRESIPATSERYTKINSAVVDMEKEITETREQLSELKEATGSDWTNYKGRIDANLADLQKSSDSIAAE